MAETTLTSSFAITDSVCDTEMHVSSVSGFAESGYLVLSDDKQDAVISYGSVKDGVFGDCLYCKGNTDAVFISGETVVSTKTPYYPELKAIYDRTGITLEQKADLMLQALGLTDDVQKWCDAVPVDYEDETKGRNWTNPETQEVVFLDYETYGVPANAYLRKYESDYVGPRNRWYYE